MTVHQTALAWREAFDASELPRGQLWERVRDRHRMLAEHAALIAGTEIREMFVTPTGLGVRLTNGLAFHVDPDAIREAPNVILAQGSYEPFEKQLLLTMAHGAKVVFDVGANIGWYAHHIAAQEQHARIFAFEPVPGTFAKLTANIALNGAAAGNIEAVGHGLSDAKGSFEMFLPGTSGSPAASLSNLHPGEQSRTVTSHFDTMDAFAAAQGILQLDFLKCDVEGAEFKVLQGGDETVSRLRPAVMIELLRKWSRAFGYHPNDVLAWFFARGYRCWGIQSARLSEVTQVTDASTETNYIFLHGDRHDDLSARLAALRA